MTTLTYAELFAGAGGLSMGLELAGWQPVAHAEIETHARAVLRHHWPECRLDGDVSALNGRDYTGVTLLSGGSPCQDLSVAGKRNGFGAWGAATPEERAYWRRQDGMSPEERTRSSLFFEQVRIWQESQAPYFLWENVLGALSSNAGRDFAAVLSAIVGAAVPVPSDGWQSAGVAAGPAGVAAWRVLDCQFFGPPQRRRRVFVLGARTGGVDPAEVLALAEGVRGDFAACDDAREGATADAGRGAAGASGYADAEVRTDAGAGVAAGVDGPDGRVRSVGGGSGEAGRTLAVNISDGAGTLDAVMGTLGARSGGQEVGAQTRGVVLTFDARGNGDGATAYAVRTAQTSANGHGVATNVAHTLDGAQGQAIVLRNREGKPGGGKGPLVSEGRSLTLASANDQVVFSKRQYGAYDESPSVASTLGARDHAAQHTDIAMTPVGIPRRLMPVECERLMGWPDGHTATGVDERGRTYALSDTARYKLCGNGVATPVAAWIAWRLRWAIERVL